LVGVGYIRNDLDQLAGLVDKQIAANVKAKAQAMFATVVDAFAKIHAHPKTNSDDFTVQLADLGLVLYSKPHDSTNTGLQAAAVLLTRREIPAGKLCFVPSARDLTMVTLADFEAAVKSKKALRCPCWVLVCI